MNVNTYDWYKMHSRDEDFVNRNSELVAFCPSTSSEVSTLERKTGMALPSTYREFLLDVGYGRVRAGEGQTDFGPINTFLSPSGIIERLDKNSSHWNIEPELFDSLDFPFLEYDYAEYFVFRIEGDNDDSVWLPHKWLKISNSFDDFLDSLRVDARFYIEKIDSFFESI